MMDGAVGDVLTVFAGDDAEAADSALKEESDEFS